MVKKEKRKIPREALEPLMVMCDWESSELGKPAAEIFKRYLGLMNKHANYFFDKPWPRKYDHKEATSFTDEDLEFLYENEEEFRERFETMCLKKNMYLGGFMGYFGVDWTGQAFYEKFVRPKLKPILEAFETLAEKEENAPNVLNKLKEKFYSVRLIHLSLIDLLEHEYLDEKRHLLVANMLELIHTVEGLKPCGEYRCELQREKLHENRDKNTTV